MQKDKTKIYSFIEPWTRHQLLDNWYNGAIKSDKQTPLGDDVFYEEQYIILLRMAGQYKLVNEYVGATWATAIKFAFEYAEALAMLGQYKEAESFITNFENKTFYSKNNHLYYGWSTLMTAIVYFHKKDFKKAWEKFKGSSVNINELLELNKEFHLIPSTITAYSPRILTFKKYSYYYFCCAKELKKKDNEDCIPVITVPKTAPEFIIKKYGKLFTKFEQ